jgi:hypothetical protein
MNVADEASRSIWMEEGPAIDALALTADERCDVAIVGAGIAGLSTAYELARRGRQVVVIDRGRIGGGMTARTTAHLSTELDDRFYELIDARGEDEARLYYESQAAAVDRIEAICREEGIDADFARIDGYLFAGEDADPEELEKEYEACRRIGVPVQWAERAPMDGIDTGRCLRFPEQGRFHPTKYLAGLARALKARGGRLHDQSAHVSEREGEDGVEIETARGQVIRAAAALFATNSPTNNKVAIHAKQAPFRTYVIAGRVPQGSVADALLWDTLDPYHYVRIQPLNTTSDLLIVGGEDHRAGEADDMKSRLQALERWTKTRFPSFEAAQYRWSGQVMEPADFLPFSGRNPGNERIFIHSGDSGQGITNGVAGSLVIADLILGVENRFAALFDPGRKPVGALAPVVEFLEGQAGAVRNFAEYLGPGEISAASELRRGEGAILRRGMSKIAICRTEEGELIERSAVCTHLGCIVHWNSFEQCWDCPCHGSQFAPNGEVLNGPAKTPLARTEPAS